MLVTFEIFGRLKNPGKNFQTWVKPPLAESKCFRLPDSPPYQIWREPKN